MPLTDGKTCLAFLAFLSLSSSLLATIQPFLKVASFELQKPLDISLARHYNGSRGMRWRLLELNDKATESTITLWRTGERVRR